jgi:hypothetical protein
VGVIHIVVVVVVADAVVLWIPHEVLQEGVTFVFHVQCSLRNVLKRGCFQECYRAVH